MRKFSTRMMVEDYPTEFALPSHYSATLQRLESASPSAHLDRNHQPCRNVPLDDAAISPVVILTICARILRTSAQPQPTSRDHHTARQAPEYRSTLIYNTDNPRLLLHVPNTTSAITIRSTRSNAPITLEIVQIPMLADSSFYHISLPALDTVWLRKGRDIRCFARSSRR
ncbi:hypothetical protein Acr_03g0009820 [Actinidia rufa]|uniref:Uncharacterized protein n=1 Tax=Actinidia rufa TaxID=165716 RepID=A0A7J0ECK1_9ERIC|nr:hypothetical protein Acr_03g0009820 [Actinidia rufa]